MVRRIRMLQTLSQVKDHLTVIIGECDMLEDILPAQTDLLTRINVIRNAAYRVVRAIDGQSRPASKMLVVDRHEPHVHGAGANVEVA